MDEQFDQLVSYIKQHLEQGVPEDHIRQLLHQHNWNPELVDRAFSAVKAPAPPTYQQPTSFPQSVTLFKQLVIMLAHLFFQSLSATLLQ
jgi:hypothetical protein